MSPVLTQKEAQCHGHTMLSLWKAPVARGAPKWVHCNWGGAEGAGTASLGTYEGQQSKHCHKAADREDPHHNAVAWPRTPEARMGTMVHMCV